MGTRWILEVTCPQCGFQDDDVPFAPTCDLVDWKCPECGLVVDLYGLTGITYEDASSAKEIAEMCRGVLQGEQKVLLEPTMIPCATCGRPTTVIGSKRCNWCWEVESRLEAYLEFERGRDFVQRMLWRVGL